MFKTKYVRIGKALYALPAEVQKTYFTEFDLEPEPLTSEHLKHIRGGLEAYLKNVEDRDLEFKISNGVIREISVYSLPTGSSRLNKDYSKQDGEKPVEDFYGPF